MKVIITGGAGFIASHVAEAYVGAGYAVVVVDNLFSGKRGNVPKKVKFYKADIRNAAAIKKIFQHEKPDAVNHHAALISVTESVKHPRETFATNVMGTLNVLLAFAEVPSHAGAKKKFLFSSTGGAIYGNPKNLPANESTEPKPLSPYALSKYIDEQMIAYYCGAYGISYVIFRYANIYGPRQRAQGGAGIFPTFAAQMRAGATPTIFGDGKKTRDYVYVGDVAQANLLALTRGKNEIINIASSRETSDYEIFKTIAATLGFKKEPHYTPKRKGEVERISMSFKKARHILGWTPKTTLKEGVQKTLRLV